MQSSKTSHTAGRARLGHIAALLGAAALSLVAVAPANAAYWAVFNVQGEASYPTAYAMYANRTDMLNDTNRTYEQAAVNQPNLVDSGSDGTNYWNLYNVEIESNIGPAFTTYATRADMFANTNITGFFQPVSAGSNDIVGGG
jgi:hypothetical protein